MVYKDLNGDGVVNNYDRAAIGNPRTPEIQFGIPLGLSYKGFDFSMLWQGSALCSVQLSGPAVWDFPLYDQSRIGKVRRMHLDRWTPETAATAKYPALHYGIHNNNKQQYSSLFLYDASYIRLKNVEIGLHAAQSLDAEFKYDAKKSEYVCIVNTKENKYNPRYDSLFTYIDKNGWIVFSDNILDFDKSKGDFGFYDKNTDEYYADIHAIRWNKNGTVYWDY